MHRRATRSVTPRLASIRLARAARAPRRLALLTASLALFFAAPAAASDVYATSSSGISHSQSNVAQYNVGAGGKLAAKNPATVPIEGDSLGGIGVSPDGQSVYTTFVTPDSGGIAQFHVGAGGKLVAKNPAFVFAGNTPEGIAVSPDSKSVYVANELSDNVSQY